MYCSSYLLVGKRADSWTEASKGTRAAVHCLLHLASPLLTEILGNCGCPLWGAVGQNSRPRK